jgi:hypothetical protein
MYPTVPSAQHVKDRTLNVSYDGHVALSQPILALCSGVRRLVGVRLAEQRKSRVVFGHPSKLHMPRRPTKRTAASPRNPPAQTVRVHHYAS